MRFIALGAVLQGSVVTADRTGLSAHLPDWLLQIVSVIAFLSICAAGVARVTTVENPRAPAP